jgi:hypothetical protein
VPITYDVTTPRGQVRLLAFDFDVTDGTFDDTEIDAFLSINNQDVRLAAAQAVDVLAGNQSYAYKHAKTGDIMVDPSKATTLMKEYATELRRQVYEGSGDMSEQFDWAEGTYDEFSTRERVIKQFIRLQGG